MLAKTVGRGTALLERSLPGAEVDVLGPLGTSFPTPGAERVDLLVAGGVGLPPLYMQGELAAAQQLAARSELLYGGRGAPGPRAAARDGGDGARPAPDHRGRHRRD